MRNKVEMTLRFVWITILSFTLSPLQIALADDSQLLGDDFRLGRCNSSSNFVLVVHGGTVRRNSGYPGRTALMERILLEARVALDGGAKSLDIVHNAVRAMEDSGLFNAGRGARANQAGTVEMDASIMDGSRLNAGAVAAVKRVKNPITAARLVMQRSPHVMMVGPDADAFASKNFAPTMSPGYFKMNGLDFGDMPLPSDLHVTSPDESLPLALRRYSGVWAGVFDGALSTLLVVEHVTETRFSVMFAHGIDEDSGANQGHAGRYQARFQNGALQFSVAGARPGQLYFRMLSDTSLDATFSQSNDRRLATTFRRLDAVPEQGNHGTVGAVALDRCGDLSAATSTGGFGSKVPGRVGDSPIIGAGTYANNKTAAISATGHGEYFMRHVVAYDISALMEYGGLDLNAAARRTISGKLTLNGGRGGVIAVDRDGNVAMVFNTVGMLRGVVGYALPLKVGAL